MKEPPITLDITKFKEILLHSWDLLPAEMQHELIKMGIYPRK